jgi:hypothetical protein
MGTVGDQPCLMCGRTTTKRARYLNQPGTVICTPFQDCEAVTTANRTRRETVNEIAEWLRTTCDDMEDHTCESCFQGRPGCEFKHLSELISRKFG